MDNYYFKHSSHFGDMFGLFQEFYRTKTLSDVMIACEGKSIHAHRMVLSAGSDYFRKILANLKNNQQYPVLIINDVSYDDMQTIVEFIYRGQIVVSREKVESLRQAAYKLRIKGFENFLRKQLYANGSPMGNGGFKNGNMRNISLLNLNESKRMMQMSDAMENKKFKSNHNGDRMSSKDLLIFNRYQEEAKRLSGSHLENALQRVNSGKKLSYEQLLRLNAMNNNNEKADSPNGELMDLKMNKNDSDSVTITAVNGDSNESNNKNYDESEDNHKNENAENGVAEKMNGKNEKGNNNDDECDEDDDQEVNYTYELDPNALTQWDSYNDENVPEGNNDSGEGYEDEEDYFETVNRSSLEMIFNQNNIVPRPVPNGGAFFYCEHCPKYFFDEDHLQLHIKRSHGMNKLNECNLCGKTYAWKSGLYKHKRAVHNITTKTLANVEQNSIETSA